MRYGCPHRGGKCMTRWLLESCWRPENVSIMRTIYQQTTWTSQQCCLQLNRSEWHNTAGPNKKHVSKVPSPWLSSQLNNLSSSINWGRLMSVARPEARRSKDIKTWGKWKFILRGLKFLRDGVAVNVLRLMGSYLVICNLNAESYHGPLADHWSLHNSLVTTISVLSLVSLSPLIGWSQVTWQWQSLFLQVTGVC